MRKHLLSALAGSLMALGAAAGNAAVIDYTAASTGTSGSIFGGTVNWTMTSSGVLNNSQKFDGQWKPAGSSLAFQRDGYGVGLNDDEITTAPTGQEWIDITFSRPVLLTAFFFLDLFTAQNGSSFEVGQVQISGGPTLSVNGTDIANTGAPGFAGSYVKPVIAQVLRFTVLSSNDNYGFADGALAAIEVAPVPVPAAGVLLAGGLGGLALIRRRRKA